MIITPVDHGFVLAHSKGERSPGLHMSDLYGPLYQALDPKRYKKDQPFDLLRLEAGLAWEETLEKAVKERLLETAERPGEFTTPEGIVFTPDLIIYTDNDARLGEIKLTWMSTKDVPRERVTRNMFPPKFNKYFTQMKCYGHHLEMPKQRLIAFFVNGSYAPPSPELLAWDIEFTAREMKDEWLMVRNYGKTARLL